ncbi:ribonuclease HII [bacterium]|nr:ribonuclease HII [bacterium]
MKKEILKREYFLYKMGYFFPIGIDEAGRGPLAGPVVIASVYSNSVYVDGVYDSKQLSKKQREEIYKEIIQKNSYTISVISSQEIDKINILNATKKGMLECFNSLYNQIKTIDIALIDGNQKVPGIEIDQLTVVKGDSKSYSIAAASIVAKVYRDSIMEELDQKYPQYNFKNNQGYGTKEHIEAIKKYGVIPEHRLTFKPIHDIIKTENSDKNSGILEKKQRKLFDF